MKKPPHLAFEKIKSLIGDFVPETAIILGSGLNSVLEDLQEKITIPYSEIPGFPGCTVEGHLGNLHFAYLNKIPVAVFQGRSHFYEGFFHLHESRSTKAMMTPIRTFKLLGGKKLIVTNAAGSLHEHIVPGHLVAISDHINFQFNNPLVGENDEEYGPRFIGMEDAYDPEIRQHIVSCAKALNIPMSEGVYVGVLGPMFETPAEIRAFRILGADVVGMSTISDVITARHCGLNVGVISAITNLASGMSPEKLSHEQTLRGALLGVDRLRQLLTAVVAKI